MGRPNQTMVYFKSCWKKAVIVMIARPCWNQINTSQLFNNKNSYKHSRKAILVAMGFGVLTQKTAP